MEDNKSNLTVVKNENFNQLGNWISRNYMKRFFDYGETQILELSKHKSIVTSRIGNRLFFELSSVLKFLEDHAEVKKK
jgi:hypothetical protein